MNLLALLFLLTASSEALKEPSVQIKNQCMAQAAAIRTMHQYKEQGVPVEAILDMIPDSWSAEQRADAAHAVAQVYGLQGKELSDWFGRVMGRCLQTGHGDSRD